MENTPRCICTIETFFLDVLFGGFCITRRVFTCTGKGRGGGEGGAKRTRAFSWRKGGDIFLA